jgi:hypothetical protein
MKGGPSQGFFILFVFMAPGFSGLDSSAVPFSLDDEAGQYLLCVPLIAASYGRVISLNPAASGMSSPPFASVPVSVSGTPGEIWGRKGVGFRARESTWAEQWFDGSVEPSNCVTVQFPG